MCHLQKLYEKYHDRGLVIIGFNCSDDKGITRALLRENGVTFPNIRDVTRVAWKVLRKAYKDSGTTPLNYIIDREGKVVDAWYGYEEGHQRALTALEKAGLKVEE
jgi:glutathione peroxidase-family protein